MYGKESVKDKVTVDDFLPGEVFFWGLGALGFRVSGFRILLDLCVSSLRRGLGFRGLGFRVLHCR